MRCSFLLKLNTLISSSVNLRSSKLKLYLNKGGNLHEGIKVLDEEVIIQEEPVSEQFVSSLI